MFEANGIISVNGIRYRILFHTESSVALYNIDSSKCGVKYTFVDKHVLTEQFEQGEIFFEADPFEELRCMGSDKDKTRMEESYALIEPIVSDPNVLYSKSSFATAVKAVAKGDISLSRKVYRLVGRWFQRGQCKAALLPDYRVVGKGARHLVKNPGKKGAIASPILTDRIKAIMDKVIRKYVLVEDGLSLSKAYAELTISFKKHFPESPLVPSFSQFRNFYYSITNRRDRNLKKNSSRVFNKDIAAKTSSVYESCFGPGDIYEIDATVDNVYLVSAGPDACSIGRPILYSVTDRYTGMVVGVSVSLENAQYKSAAEALYCAISDKRSYFKDTFGIELQFDWDVSGIPAYICADNAELEGSKIEIFARTHSVSIINTAPYRADQKGTVESSIGMIQAELRSFIKFSTVSEIKLKKAGGKDNRTKGFLTLNEYRNLVLLAVNSVNHRIRNKMPSDYPVQLNHDPSSLWTWAISTGASYLKSVNNPLALRLSLLPQKTATVSRDGIKCMHIMYTCDYLEQEGWFDRDKNSKKSYKPLMVVDDGNVANAWIYPDPTKNPGVFYRCKLSPSSSFLTGCCLYEAEHLINLKSESIARTLAKQNELRSQAREQMKVIVKEADDRKRLYGCVLSEKEQKARMKTSRSEEMVRDSRSHSLDNTASNDSKTKYDQTESKAEQTENWSPFDIFEDAY